MVWFNNRRITQYYYWNMQNCTTFTVKLNSIYHLKCNLNFNCSLSRYHIPLKKIKPCKGADTCSSFHVFILRFLFTIPSYDNGYRKVRNLACDPVIWSYAPWLMLYDSWIRSDQHYLGREMSKRHFSKSSMKCPVLKHNH